MGHGIGHAQGAGRCGKSINKSAEEWGWGKKAWRGRKKLYEEDLDGVVIIRVYGPQHFDGDWAGSMCAWLDGFSEHVPVAIGGWNWNRGRYLGHLPDGLRPWPGAARAGRANSTEEAGPEIPCQLRVPVIDPRPWLGTCM